MRFELDHCDYRVYIGDDTVHYIVWVSTFGTINCSTLPKHTLQRAYSSILQSKFCLLYICNPGRISQQIALILFASLVLF